MILARIFSSIYKDGGIILIDAKGQKYICGSPRKDNPVTIKLLKDNTDREIIVREKPYNPKSYLDDQGRMMPGPSKNKQPERPFEWTKVHAVVTFNSSITIKALHNGVPCFTNFENLK